MKSTILFAILIVFVSSTGLYNFNILTGNSTSNSPVCMRYNSTDYVLSLGEQSDRNYAQCVWNAVNTSTNSGFQLINMANQEAVSIYSVSEWSAIGQQNIVYPPPTYVPVALGINTLNYRPSTMVWNVVGNGQTVGTPVSLYSQQAQTLAEQNQAFWFVNRDFVLPGGTDGTQLDLDNMFQKLGQAKASLTTEAGG